MVKRKLLKAFSTLLVPFAVLLGTLFVSSETVQAKELENVITSIELLNASDTTQTTDAEGVYNIRTGNAYKLRALFDLKAYNNNLSDGDTFTLAIPAPMTVYSGTSQLTDSDSGVNIAEAKVTSNGTGAGGTAVITLKNLQEYLDKTGGDIVKDVSGNFAVAFLFSTDQTKTPIVFDSTSLSETITHTYSSKTISGTEEGYENFAKNGGTASKDAWDSPALAAIGSKSSGEYYSAWRVRVNTGGQDYGSNLVLTDTIPSDSQYAAIQYIPESVKVYDMPSMVSSTSAPIGGTLLTEGTDYTLQWNANYTNFTITFKDGSKKYFVTYNTTTPNDGSTVGNTVSLAKEDGTALTQRSNNTRTVMTASATSLYSGTIVASTAYKVKINKTDAFNLAPVAGAVYTVTAPDGSTQDITTNENGLALTTEYDPSLVGQTFKIKEKTAPTGYKLDPTEYTVKLGATGSTVNIQDDPEPGLVDIIATKKLTGQIGRAHV